MPLDWKGYGTYIYIDAICVHDENDQHMYTSHPVLTDLSDRFPLQSGVSAAHSAVRNGHLAVLKFLIEECNCGTEEKTHVCVLMHACMCCICLPIPWLCVHACMHVYTYMCILCVCYTAPSSCQCMYIVWRQLAPLCCDMSAKRSSQVPCGRARCQCEWQKCSMYHAEHNALCCELTVCVHMVMVIITMCIRTYVQYVLYMRNRVSHK